MLSQAIHELHPRKTAKEVWRLASASVTVRNFPLSAEELRKVLGIKNGNAGNLFGCTLADGRKVVLECGKVGASDNQNQSQIINPSTRISRKA